MQLLGMSGGGGGAGTAGVGLIQSVLGLISQRRLSKIARPEIETNPEMYQSAQRAEQRAQYGYAPTQTAAYQNRLNQAMNTDYYNNRNMAGGGLAQALVGRQTGQRLGSLNQFASDDATKMQANMQYSDSLRRFLQSQKNLEQQQKIAYRMNDERNTGAMLSSGLNNLGSSVNSMQALGGGQQQAQPSQPSYNSGETGSYFPTPGMGNQSGFAGLNLINQSNAPGIYGNPFNPQ